MSKKDYIALAKILAQHCLNDSQRALLALEFGYHFQAGNAKFDMDKWLKACNCGQNKKPATMPTLAELFEEHEREIASR